MSNVANIEDQRHQRNEEEEIDTVKVHRHHGTENCM